MTATKVLFVGGNGRISAACSQAAVAAGLELHALSRGRTGSRPFPAEAHVHRGDIEDAASVRELLDREQFDAVVDWIAFTADQVRARTDLVSDRVGQYVFISSASAYQTPPARLPIVESTPLRNPFLAYSRDKIAGEEVLTALYRDSGFPMTIVRPSHTYDRTAVPLSGGWTAVERMRQGRPVVVHGDGTSLWTLTHSEDFARGLVPLLGDSRTHGEAFHITSDEVLTWDRITSLVGAAAGCEPRIVHVPSDTIAAADPVWGAALLGDKAHSMVFDNGKLRRLVPAFAATIPFERGIRQVVEWYDADASRRTVDARLDAVMDDLVRRFAPAAG